jgi:hypothetical protein
MVGHGNSIPARRGPSAEPMEVSRAREPQYDIKHCGILFASITLVSRCVVSKRVHGPAPQGGAVLLSERQAELP